MQVKVKMAIDMIEPQAGRSKTFELRVNLGPQLAAQAAIEVIAKPGADGVAGEFLPVVHQAGNCFARASGTAAQQGQVQPHTQIRILPGQGRRFAAGRLIHHQAGARQDALAMSPDHGLVDRA